MQQEDKRNKRESLFDNSFISIKIFVLVSKIHVCNDIKSDAQYYVKQGNKKIHLHDLIFDELDNSDNIIDYICEEYAPIILLFDKISHRFVPKFNIL